MAEPTPAEPTPPNVKQADVKQADNKQTNNKQPGRRLHLGCGQRYIPGFYHIDARPWPHVDYVARIERLDFISDATVDLIYASHVLEHFSRWECLPVLKEWGRVLRPGGVLRLAVPDFAACAKLYYEHGLEDALNGLIGLISGGQRHPDDFHKMVFDEQLLSQLLVQAGFASVRHWDWRLTEHQDVDDFSQAYLPHLDKTGGTHMSLNLEAIR
ncbi:MAG: methyltransferase domain-containing protein [Rhodospirillaceae bacterium]